MVSREEDFIMQTDGQVSSAPVRHGSRAGRECLASEGNPTLARHRCQLSFLFLIHSEGGHTAPPPPEQRNVLFCTALLAAPRPSVEIPQA